MAPLRIRDPFSRSKEENLRNEGNHRAIPEDCRSDWGCCGGGGGVEGVRGEGAGDGGGGG